MGSHTRWLSRESLQTPLSTDGRLHMTLHLDFAQHTRNIWYSDRRKLREQMSTIKITQSSREKAENLKSKENLGPKTLKHTENISYGRNGRFGALLALKICPFTNQKKIEHLKCSNG